MHLSKSKVLLAEDDLSLGYVIKDNLIDAGYEVVLCPDGQSAIDKFDKNEFDICLLDVMMPNTDRRYSHPFFDCKISGRRQDKRV